MNTQKNGRVNNIYVFIINIRRLFINIRIVPVEVFHETPNSQFRLYGNLSDSGMRIFGNLDFLQKKYMLIHFLFIVSITFYRSIFFILIRSKL